MSDVSFSELVAFARKWFSRRVGTAFDRAELKAIERCRPLSREEIDVLDWWYCLPKDECLKVYGNGRRQGIASLFNNINAELGKAQNAFDSKPKAPIVKLTDLQRVESCKQEFVEWCHTKGKTHITLQSDISDFTLVPSYLLTDFLRERK